MPGWLDVVQVLGLLVLALFLLTVGVSLVQSRRARSGAAHPRYDWRFVSLTFTSVLLLVSLGVLAYAVATPSGPGGVRPGSWIGFVIACATAAFVAVMTKITSGYLLSRLNGRETSAEQTAIVADVVANDAVDPVIRQIEVGEYGTLHEPVVSE